MKRIVIYTSPSCGYCTMAKQYFNQIGAKYEEKDVSDPKNAEEVVQKSGQMGVPVTFIGEGDGTKMIVGFNKEEIDRALK